MKYLVAQVGARRNYAIPRILHRAGALARLHTDICSSKGLLRLVAAIPAGLRTSSVEKIASRSPRGVPSRLVTSYPLVGLRYALQLRRMKQGKVYAAYLWAAREICRRILKAGFGDADALHVFNGAGLELLEEGAKRGLRGVMEQTIAPLPVQESLDAQEQDLHPGWEEPLARDPAANDFAQRERAEWGAADTITCGSSFVVDGIAKTGGPVQKCVVVPYGAGIPTVRPRGRRREGPLRVLVVGLMCLRKGTPYVLEVAKRLGAAAQVRMVGPSALTGAAMRRVSEAVEVVGAVARTSVEEHYRWADVFFLPSVCEGSAEVCNEALSGGLPVVTTPNTGSIVTHGSDGFVCPIRDVEAMADALRRLARDPGLLAELGEGARRSADTVTEESYAGRLLRVLLPEAGVPSSWSGPSRVRGGGRR